MQLLGSKWQIYVPMWEITKVLPCYEELVLLQPQDASLHCMLGELYLMMGSSSSLLSNLILARKHIALSLELSGDSSNNLRALYALVDATV